MVPIVRARLFSSILKRNHMRCFSVTVNTPKEPLASSEQVAEQVPPPASGAVGRFLMYGLAASVTGVLATAGYATYAYSLDEVDEKTKAFRASANIPIQDNGSTLDKFQAMIHSAARTVIRVIRVFEALTLVVITVLSTRIKDTEGTNFCVAVILCIAVIHVFEALPLTMVRVLNKSTKGGEQFSNLPNLVLWKIIDRLDFPDSLSIASVCKGWRVASLSYTKIVKFRGESLPWIMVRSVQGSSESNFINMSSGETYSIFNQDFCQAGIATLFSKQGWFLLHNKFGGGFDSGQLRMGNVFLLNPFTNKKIELPLRSILSRECENKKNWFPLRKFFLDICCGAFTIKDGKPDLVAVAIDTPCCGFGCIRLWTICMGRKDMWAEHTYKCSDWISAERVEIIGQHIYIISGFKTFLIFSLSNGQWIPVKQSWDECEHVYFVETDEGEIWKIHLPRTTFHRLSIRGWEDVKVKEHKHLCCFVKHASVDYLVSKFVAGDVVDAFSDYMEESDLFERKIIEYKNDANKINRVVMYIIRENIDAHWVDMP